MDNSSSWNELRCKKCNKLIGKHHVHSAALEIKCVRCGHINSILEENDRQVFLTDHNGKIIYINSLVKEITGYSAPEVLGKTPAVWGGQMPETFYKKLWRTILKEKKATSFKVVNKKKNGELYNALVRISPILNAEGEVELFLGIQTLL